MPGRDQRLSGDLQTITDCGIKRVVCLAPCKEIMNKSPEYHQLLESENLPWIWDPFCVPDYGVPENREEFLRLALFVANRLREGESVLVHCGAGIGRTGMFAVCILLALGVEKEAALDQVKSAGSCPETEEQEELVDWVVEKLIFM